MAYWEDRVSKSQNILTDKRASAINKQIEKYYKDSMKRVINAFIETYRSILEAGLEDREPTPADLYKLDTYWKMEAELNAELQKLGNKELLLLNENFINHFQDIYDSLALPAGAAFSNFSRENIKQMVNTVWATDGKEWSQRIWTNNAKLAETSNEELLHCVVTGKQPKDLKNLLQERFRVSYQQADTLVRTEMAHIQAQAAHKRYIDAGIDEFEVWASEDERRCKVCGKLHKKRYPITANPPIPAHPNCRCTIIPVIK